MSEKKCERYYRQIKTRKQREGESDLIIKFGLMVVELGKDDEGDVIDTCHVVLETDNEFESVVPIEVLDKDEQAVLDADRIFAALPDPDTLLQRCKMTEMQVKILIHRDLVKNLGQASPAKVKAFLDAGFTESHVLNIILAVSVKVLSNYTNHAFATEVDERFAAYKVA